MNNNGILTIYEYMTVFERERERERGRGTNSSSEASSSCPSTTMMYLKKENARTCQHISIQMTQETIYIPEYIHTTALHFKNSQSWGTLSKVKTKSLGFDTIRNKVGVRIKTLQKHDQKLQGNSEGTYNFQGHPNLC
jgi:hypothetical protein